MTILLNNSGQYSRCASQIHSGSAKEARYCFSFLDLYFIEIKCGNYMRVSMPRYLSKHDPFQAEEVSLLLGLLGWGWRRDTTMSERLPSIWNAFKYIKKIKLICLNCKMYLSERTLMLSVSSIILAQVAEVAVQLFISNDKPNCSGLILAGSADFKTELSQSDMFDSRLQVSDWSNLKPIPTIAISRPRLLNLWISLMVARMASIRSCLSYGNHYTVAMNSV